MLGYTSWILLRLCALTPRTSSEPVAAAGLCSVMDTEKAKPETGRNGRGSIFMWFITWYDEQGGNGSRMALISGLVMAKSLGFLIDSHFL